MDSERVYINVLKGFLIILVVIGHFGQTIGNNLPANIAFIGQGIILFIYSFHMPLFLFISGYLSKNAEKRREKAFTGLFVPYILFQLLVGFCELILLNRGGLQNIFIPYIGAWYLLTLFSYRLILPEVCKLKGIGIIAIILTIITCFFTGMGGEFAIKKTLGFFIYFIAGYFSQEIPKNRIKKLICVIALLLIVAGFIIISWRTDCYDTIIAVLTHSANSIYFLHWYIAPLLYLAAFVISSFVCILIMNVLPSKCSVLENQGQDTMPMYISHLFVFLAVSYLVPKDNWILIVIISFVCIFVSLVLFSRNWYRKLFNNILNWISKILIKNT